MHAGTGPEGEKVTIPVIMMRLLDGQKLLTGGSRVSFGPRKDDHVSEWSSGLIYMRMYVCMYE
jgi:hypothetical protein